MPRHGPAPFPGDDFPLLADAPEDAGRLPLGDAAVRTLLCVGRLPGEPDLPNVAGEIVRVLTPGGALLVCVPLLDYRRVEAAACWRPTPASVQRLFDGLDATIMGWQGADAAAHTIYGIGFKSPLPGNILQNSEPFFERFQHRLDRSVSGDGWPQRIGRLLRSWTGGPAASRRRRAADKIQFTVHLAVHRHLEQPSSDDCLPKVKLGGRLDLIE